MNILNIKLHDHSGEPDSRLCDFCPCYQANEYGSQCGMRYWDDNCVVGVKYEKTGEIESMGRDDEGHYLRPEGKRFSVIYIRPQKCIDEHGK